MKVKKQKAKVKNQTPMMKKLKKLKQKMTKEEYFSLLCLSRITEILLLPERVANVQF